MNLAEVIAKTLQEHHETATLFCTCGFVPPDPWPVREFTQQPNPHQLVLINEAVVAAIRAMTPAEKAELIGGQQVWTVAYDDSTPGMDGPHRIRMGEFRSLDEAQDAVRIVTDRSERSPKRNLDVETRVVTAWEKTG